MKRIVILTESELVHLVNRVLNEQDTLGQKWGTGKLIRLPMGSDNTNDYIRIEITPKRGKDDVIVAVKTTTKLRSEIKNNLDVFNQIEKLLGNKFFGSSTDPNWDVSSGLVDSQVTKNIVDMLKKLKVDSKNNMFTESVSTRLINKVIKEQTQKKKINGSAMSFLQNTSPSMNPALGVNFIPECYRYSRSVSGLMANYGASDSEIDSYIDYLGVYGKVPGTGIPIPYQGNDLQMMLQILWGSGTGGSFGGNFKELGPIEDRTLDLKGVLYPTVEDIRASYTKKKGESLYKSLSKKFTDSKEDIQKKNQIINVLLDAYQKWIDCVNEG
jgi:hypothetical protein